jgi:uncharacterized protein (UPF0333 family)
MLKTRKNKGQSTIEYILLAAAVIAVLVIFLRPNGPFASSYNSALSDSAESMNSMTGRLTAGFTN